MLQENLLGEPDFYCDLLQFYFSFDSKEDSVSSKATVSFCNTHEESCKNAQRQTMSASFLPLDFVNKSATETCFLFSPVGLTHSAFPFLLLPQADGGGTHGQRSNRNNLLLLLLSRHHGKISSLLPLSSFPKKLQGTQYRVIKAAGRDEEEREKERRELALFLFVSNSNPSFILLLLFLAP